jgi:hypothetical protein
MAIVRLQRLIESSGLSEADKDMWLHTLEVIDDEQAQAVLDAVGADLHELESFTHNLKLKQIAFARGDDTLLDQLLEEEVEEFTHL